MRAFWPNKRTPIGIDVGAQQVKAVQLEACGSSAAPRWRITAATRFPRAEPGATVSRTEAQRISDVLYRNGFSGQRAVLAMPSEKTYSGVLELPPRAANVPFERIARMELARTTRCAPDSFEMGCWDLPVSGKGNKSHVMAVGCPHIEANVLLDAFEREGFDVVALDIPACALARAASAARLPPSSGDTTAPRPGVTAVLDVGWNSAVLVMLYNNAIIYSRSLGDGGLRPLHAALQDRLSLEADVADYVLGEIGLTNPQSVPVPTKADEVALSLPAEARSLVSNHLDAMVKELNVSLSYIVHEYPDAPLTRLLLTGGGAGMPGLSQHLGSVIGIEARALTPAELAEYPPPLLPACTSPALTLALGLAQFTEG